MGSIDSIKISILFCQNKKMYSLTQWWSIERSTIFESDLFRAHFLKTMILSNFQDVAMVPIEKDDGTLQTKRG